MIPGLPPLTVIETITLGADAATVKLPASGTIADLMPSGSRHVVVLVNGRSSGDPGVARDNFQLQFNEDTGANYHHQYFAGLASSASAARASLTYGLMQGSSDASPANAMSGGFMLIPHAFNTANFKSALVLSGADEDIVQTATLTWTNTAAVTDVTVGSLAGDLAAGSIVKLCVVDEEYLVTDGEEILSGDSAFTAVDVPSQVGDISIINYLRSSHTGDNNDGIDIVLNDDETAGNYSGGLLMGIGSSVFSSNTPAHQTGGCNGDNADANHFSGALTSVSAFNYGDNDPHVLTLSGERSVSTSSGFVGLCSTRRNNVEAVTSVNIKPKSVSTFLAGSGQWVYAVPKTLLERKTLTDATTTSVTFTLSGLTIPDSVKDLRLNVYAKGDEASVYDWVSMSINSDTTAANYDNQELYGIGGSAGAGTSAASRRLGTIGSGNSGANVFGGFTALFPHYASTSLHKHYLSLGGGSEQIANMLSGRWENDDAIATITLTLEQGDDFVAGSIFELEAVHGALGWSGTVMGVANPAKVMGVERANIGKIMGVA